MKYVMDYLSIHWKTIIKRIDIQQLSVIFNNISNENEYKVVSFFDEFKFLKIIPNLCSNFFFQLQEIFSTYPETFRHRDKDILRRSRDTIVSKLNWKRRIGQFI